MLVKVSVVSLDKTRFTSARFSYTEPVIAGIGNVIILDMRSPVYLALAATFAAASASATTISIGDTSYVVRLHSSTPEALAYQSNDSGESLPKLTLTGEPMPMTSSNGKRYLCYIPESKGLKEDTEAKPKQSWLDVASEAARNLKPHCLPTVEPKLDGAFEICHGESISVSEIEGTAVKHDTKTQVGVLQADSRQLAFIDYEFRNADRYPEDKIVHDRVSKGEMVYTQAFGPERDDIKILVQYVCWNTSVTSPIGRRVPNLSSPSSIDHAISFLFGSRWFCLNNEAESINDVAVSGFFSPSFESDSCIRRTEGWWTYELCIGDRMSQFHREQNGELTAEFSLGTYNADANLASIKSRKSIVSEFLDDTYDKPQPAFEEVYEGGTPCDEVGRKRWTRVLMFCPTLKKQTPYIISIQESATCSYLLKVAVPSLCEHPYFAKEEQLRLELLSQTIHCVRATEPSKEAQNELTSATLSAKVSEKDEL
ncbi:unnamed protein product [Aphanomyces euteiches]